MHAPANNSQPAPVTTSTVRDVVREVTADLRTDVQMLKTDVSTLKTDVAALKADVSELKIDVSAIRKTVAILQINADEDRSYLKDIFRIVSETSAAQRQWKDDQERITALEINQKQLIKTVGLHSKQLAAQ